ncbi:MAG: thioredoxin family protein [Myxococcota bacterium]
MRNALMAMVVFGTACSTPVATTSEVEAASSARVGKAAPDFTLTDLSGKTHKLSDYKGKTIVLEWFNPGCPYVKYAHGEGPLADQAQRTMDDNTVWIAVNSGAPGKQGHGTALNQQAKADWKLDHPILVDESGTVGKSYGAITTPHMYVIDPSFTLRYQGAIDNAPMGRANGEPVNYVDAALTDLRAGKTVKTPNTKAYGCSVKYGS